MGDHMSKRVAQSASAPTICQIRARSSFHTASQATTERRIMKRKKLMVFSACCGVLCAVCVLAFMGRVQGQAAAERAEALARYGGEQADVCVAARDIAAGETLDASMLQVQPWLADLLPDGAVDAVEKVVGRAPTTPIYEGEVVCEKRFERSGRTLDAPAGTTALSLPAKAVRAVGGALEPGMKVDVYASGDTATTAIARGVLVLATSVPEGRSASDMAWVTLAVDPASVSELIAASERTELHFALPFGASQDDGAATKPTGKSSSVGGAAPAGETLMGKER